LKDEGERTEELACGCAMAAVPEWDSVLNWESGKLEGDFEDIGTSPMKLCRFGNRLALIVDGEVISFAF